MNIPNFPTSSDYEYTDEDFARDTQPDWQAYEARLTSKISIANKRTEILRQLAELDALEEQEKSNTADDADQEDDSELRFESDYDDRPPDYNDDPLGSRNDYEPYYNIDYLLSIDKEDNTPDGWPDTFYEY